MVWPSSIDLGLIQSFQNNLKSPQISKTKTPKKQILPNNVDIELSSSQLQSILFYLPEYYTALVLSDNCSLYTLLNKKILKIAGRPIRELEVNIFEKGKRKLTKAIIPLDLFKQYYFKNKCNKSNKISKLYERENLKLTFEKVSPQIPKDKKTCEQQWEKWKSSSHTANICSIHERIKLANKMGETLKNHPDKFSLNQRSSINSLQREREFYQNNISDVLQVYYKNLCENLHTKELFCSNYISQDFWTEVLNFERPRYNLVWKCLALTKKKTSSNALLQKCVSLFKTKPQICTSRGSKLDSAIFPMPTCTQISKAQKHSRLQNNYHDCPANIRNTGVINLFRILAHFSKGQSTKAPKDCVFPSFSSVYELYERTKEQHKWPLKLCYVDKISKKEICTPYVPGNHKDLSYAQNVVIAEILFQRKLNATRPKCTVKTLLEYNPQRLAYRTGCWIVPKDKSCQSYNCPQKVIIDNREILEVYSKGQLVFNYLKNKYNDKDQDLVSRAINLYKLKQRGISSLTSARFFLDKKKMGLIHGIGCAEDFYPARFKTQGLGICTPLPFIIDGHNGDARKLRFSFRSAIDDVHSPHLISWATVFSAVSKYSEFHPLKTWNLYGIH